MITKKQIKYIKSLQLKKFRDLEGSFVVEGEKNVLSVLKSNFEVDYLVVTEFFLNKNKTFITESHLNFDVVSGTLLKTLGSYKSNEMALVIVKKPNLENVKIKDQDLVLVLDDVRDPGNFGTIIRTADWFGFQHIICSHTTTEIWNPKVVASSMGSILTMNIQYADLEPVLQTHPHYKIATLLDGHNIHDAQLDKSQWSQKGVMVLVGNESKGINPSLLKFVNQKVKIPGYGQAESLNVAVATGIICDNIVRQRHIVSQ